MTIEVDKRLHRPQQMSDWPQMIKSEGGQYLTYEYKRQYNLQGQLIWVKYKIIIINNVYYIIVMTFFKYDCHSVFQV